METIMSTLPTLTADDGSLWIASALSELLASGGNSSSSADDVAAATTAAAAAAAAVNASTASTANASKVHDKHPHGVNDSDTDLR